MRSIGIRELRQNAGRYLREVERGETIEVTDRGRPVALLVPVAHEDALERLELEGRLTASRGDPRELTEPVPPAEGAPPPSSILAGMRSGER